MESKQAAQQSEIGVVAAGITREIVRLHARLYGHGPTKAKTHVAPDFAVCVLEDVFMPAEKTLIAAGNPDQVRATRAAFQDACEGEFIAIVEDATGRKVRGFFSQVSVPSQAAIEFFLFESDRVSGDGAGPDA